MTNLKLPRRKFLHLATGAAVLPAVSRIAWAQTYPARPVRLIVGAPASSSPDILARLIGQWLSERLGQPFIIENRTGAAGNIAAEAVVRSVPDGYTLLLPNVANAINATLYENINFNFIRDLVPVAGLIGVPFVMEVNPSFPAKTVPDFIAYAKANPGKLNMASAGNGTPQHLAGALFRIMTGIDMLHVPYRGSTPAITDLIGGRVQVLFDAIPGSIQHIKARTLRPLAVTTARRQDVFPDIPTVGEFVPGYEASGWQGVAAPKNTPTEIVEKLNKEINAGLSDPKMQAQLAELGGSALALSPADFGKLISDETEKWARVIRAANIKSE